MNNIPIRDLETERLLIKKPTMKEQEDLWKILREDIVNRYYFPTPDKIFEKNNLRKDNIDDLKEARRIFMEKFNNWERQIPILEDKINSINNEENKNKFTWSIFLKDGPVIGQMTVQPSSEYPDNPEIRDVGWFIDPKYQRKGYASEAAREVLRFMFEEVEIEKIITSASTVNDGSWKLMEKLGFIRYDEKPFTYYDKDDNILTSYCYYIDREKYLDKGKKYEKINIHNN